MQQKLEVSVNLAQDFTDAQKAQAQENIGLNYIARYIITDNDNYVRDITKRDTEHPLEYKKVTTSELNAEVLRNLSIVAEDENLLRRVAKYLRRVVAEKQNDPTLMTKEEFFAKLEKGEEEYLQGKYYEMLPGESLDDFLKRVG
jgi:hypothetical protein